MTLLDYSGPVIANFTSRSAGIGPSFCCRAERTPPSRTLYPPRQTKGHALDGRPALAGYRSPVRTDRTPLMRPLFFSHDDDLAAWDHPSRFKLGDDLLANRVTHPGRQVGNLPPAGTLGGPLVRDRARGPPFGDA